MRTKKTKEKTNDYNETLRNKRMTKMVTKAAKKTKKLFQFVRFYADVSHMYCFIIHPWLSIPCII